MAVRVSILSIPGPTLLSEKQTNVEGRTLFTTHPGKYEVRAVWEADVENGNRESDSDLVDASQPGEYPITLSLATETDDSIPLVSIRGTVRTEQGEGIPKARVNLYAETPDSFSDGTDEDKFKRYKVARTLTDSKGDYTLKARLWPGACSLVASHDDYSMLEGNMRRGFSITRAGHEGVYDFILKRWEIKRILGVVVDAEGRPVSEATVDFSDWSMDKSNRFFNSLETKADGKFDIPCRLQRCTIQASKLGYKTAFKDCGVVDPALSQEVRLVLESSDATVEGQILTKSGVPLGNSKFKALEMNSASSRLQAMTPVLPFTTDSDGRFRLSCTQGTRLSFAAMDTNVRLIENTHCDIKQSTQVVLLRVEDP